MSYTKRALELEQSSFDDTGYFEPKECVVCKEALVGYGEKVTMHISCRGTRMDEGIWIDRLHSFDMDNYIVNGNNPHVNDYKLWNH